MNTSDSKETMQGYEHSKDVSWKNNNTSSNTNLISFNIIYLFKTDKQ